ncbi:MAG: HAMP domain-containing histidine kinase [Gammaproteobacteria bacterium]|nr:HAMP domain-containing histidine kinase [Gammaproteobacteria bacterium]
MNRSILGRIVRPSAFFLSSGYVILGIATLILFAAPIWYAWRVSIDDFRTRLLIEETEHFTSIYNQSGSEGLIAFIKTRIEMKIPGDNVLILTDANEHLLAGNIAAWPTHISNKTGIFTIPIILGGHLTRVVVVRTILPNGYNLLVGRDRARFVPLENSFWFALAGAGIILSIIGILGGLLLRKALLSRIQGVDYTVSAIMKGDLKHRLPTYSTGDELDTLSITINHLLEQIEQLVHGIRNVSNAIAHDLRTPLTELRTRLEELAFTQPSPQDTFIEIDGAVADVDRVIMVFNALLRLADIDAGMRRSGFTQIDINKVVAEAVDFYLPATELKGISLYFKPTEPILVNGDPILLTQAIGNLIDNAMKYVHHDDHISVEVMHENNKIHIIIADTGPGISDAEKPKVAERFFRGSAAENTSGVGLGLTLVEAVAKLHGGQLKLEDNNPGLKAIIVIR